jgi:predicted SAM-dependent methyltransferase
MTKILEIGPGTANGLSLVYPGADTVDILGDQTTYRCNWGYDPLPIPENTYDIVFSSHVLEHVAWYKVGFALQEVHRILKPGGEFEVYVPDFAYIVKCYEERRCGDNWRVHNRSGNFMTWINGRLFTYGEDATGPGKLDREIPQTHHKSCFDAAYLCSCLTAAGFGKLKLLPERLRGRSHGAIDLGVVASK